jgi:2-iminoacetate synthase ThiH
VAVSFDDVTAKVEAGERLSDADVHALESGRDIIALGMLADSVRRRLHGTTVTYVRVFDLVLAAGPPGPDAVRRAGPFGPAEVPATAGEVRLLETPLSLETAVAAVTQACELAGKTPLSAFSLAALEALADPLPVVLAALKNAGLKQIAHAPLDRLKSPEHALDAVTDAGLELARLTIEETPARDWSSVCREVAAHQRRLHSLRAFAPLPRQVDVTQPTTGYGDVKRIALSRLLVDNVETIQVDWALYGPKLAQVALTFGADDLDSVSAIDDESRGSRRSPLEEIRRSIQAASFMPVERDARFTRV